MTARSPSPRVAFPEAVATAAAAAPASARAVPARVTTGTGAEAPVTAAGAAIGRGGRSSPHLLMPITLFFLLVAIAVVRSPSLMTNAGLGGAIIVATPLVLATYALMATVIAGRGTVDLSIGPLIGFINVTLVQLHVGGVIENPIAVFAYAIAVGAAYQLIFALIVLFVRVQPIIVSLSGYLALAGINLVILPRPGGVAPPWMADWGYGSTVLTPVLAILVVATLAWILFTRTAFYGHLRQMGSDERAAYTSGVPIYLVRIGAHLISGAFAGLAAITFTALIASGDPSQGTTYTLIAVTALVLGGASLAGGRASVFGSLLGALNLYLITFVLSTFSFGAVQSFVTSLAYGTILVVSLLLTLVIPFIQRHVRRFSPLLYFVVLSVGGLGIVLHASFDAAAPPPLAFVSLSAAPAPPAAEAPPPVAAAPARLAPIPAEALYVGPLEVAEASPDERALAAAARPLVLGVVVLALVALFLRIAFTQSRREAIGPAVAVIVAALVVLGAWVIAETPATAPPPPIEGRP